VPSFRQQRRFSTREPSIVVDGDLPEGVHLFELIMVDADGNASVPATLPIQVSGRVVGPPIVDPPIVGPPIVGPPRPPIPPPIIRSPPRRPSRPRRPGPNR
jgi:hypothetical protein